MSGLLTEMAQRSLQRLEEARARESEAALWARANESAQPPKLKLSPEGFDLIAECKLHSPSAGDLSSNTADVQSRVAAYGKGGAAAVSVLTEPTRFGGELQHVTLAAQVLTPLNVPVMRKDFLVDPYQVMEARAAGAGGVLVIARMLDRSRICALLDCAAMLGMFALVEAFDGEDIAAIDEVLAQRKTHTEQILVGVNCRDLETLQVNFERLADWVDLLPPAHALVAESGVASAADVKHVVELGYHLALVGTTLMNSPDPCKLVSELLTCGRQRAMALRTRSLKLSSLGDSPEADT